MQSKVAEKDFCCDGQWFVYFEYFDALSLLIVNFGFVDENRTSHAIYNWIKEFSTDSTR